MRTFAATARRLKDCAPARFSGDGRSIVAGSSNVSAWSVPLLEPLWKVRPLRQPRGFAVQPSGSHVLCANPTQFALLDGRTGATLAVCTDEGYLWDQPFALSACGRFAIYGWGDGVRVRELATGRLVWEQRWPHGWLTSLQPLRNGTAWMLHISTRIPHEEYLPTRPHLEIWTWPFGSEPQRTLRPQMVADQAIVSPSGQIAVHGGPKLQIYPADADEPTAERETVVLDRLLGWLGDDHVVAGNDPGIYIHDARTATPVARIDLPGTFRYDCGFGPTGRDLVAWHWQKGFAYAHGVFDPENPDANPAAQIENPWPTAPVFAPKASDPRPDPWYRMPPPRTVRTVAANTIAALEDELHEFRRPAWSPIVEAVDGPITASKFGGMPYLTGETQWPRCGTCGDWLQLLVQLRSQDMPVELHDLFDGLLQAFFCTSDSCVPAEPFRNNSAIRLVTVAGPPALVRPPFDEAFGGHEISGWEKHVDYPTDIELESLGVKLRDGPEVDGEFFSPMGGDKLMGWPGWPQNVDYVKCPSCGGAMQTIVQVTSEHNVPYMFGDGGLAWVSQCRMHREMLALHCGW